jgi:hypothetical protein
MLRVTTSLPRARRTSDAVRVSELFASEKARAQVTRVLEYVAYPGMACILDDGLVIGAAGALAGFDPAQLASVLGAHEDAAFTIENRALRLDDEHVVIVRALPGDRRLVVLLPSIITGASARIDRAVDVLRRMLRNVGGTKGAPPSAHAAVFVARGGRRRARSD